MALGALPGGRRVSPGPLSSSCIQGNKISLLSRARLELQGSAGGCFNVMSFTFPTKQQMLLVSQSQLRRAKAWVPPAAEMFSIGLDTLCLLPVESEVCWNTEGIGRGPWWPPFLCLEL